MWVALVVLALMVGLQLLPVVLSRKAIGKQVPELTPFLNDGQKQAARLLVYFWSPTCAMCRPMSKAIDAIGSDSIVKINMTNSGCPNSTA